EQAPDQLGSLVKAARLGRTRDWERGLNLLQHSRQHNRDREERTIKVGGGHLRSFKAPPFNISSSFSADLTRCQASGPIINHFPLCVCDVAHTSDCLLNPSSYCRKCRRE